MKMKRLQLKASLKRHILLLTLLPSLLISALLTSYFIITRQIDAEDELLRQVTTTIKYLSKSSELALFVGNTDELFRLTWTVESDKKIKTIIFFNHEKKQILSSGDPFKNPSVFMKNGYFRKDLGGKWLFQMPVSYSQVEVADYPLSEGASEPVKTLGWIQIIADKNNLLKKQRSILIKGASIGVVVFLLLAFAAQQFSRSITRPLDEITHTIAKFEAGDLSARVNVVAQGELDTLVKGINRLAEKVELSSESLQKRVDLAVIKLTHTLEELEDKNNKLKQTGIELTQANKAKDDFLASMSHELRTPLTAILGYSRLLKKTNLSEKQLGHTKVIQQASTMLLSLIDNILDFSKLKSHSIVLEYLPFSLESLLEDVLDLHLPEAQSKGIKLIVKVDLDVPLDLIGDELRIKQIINNLVHNAIKFTRHGSVLVKVSLLGMSTEQEQHQGSENYHIKKDKFGLFFEVRDTGIGMNIPDSEYLFEPFSQADSSISRRFGGSGLGLMICKNLVDLFDGEIKINSEKGKGTKVTFSILKIEKQGKMVKTVSLGNYDGVQDLNLLSGLTILIAEDNLFVKELLETILKSEGINVISVDNGEKALQKCNDHNVDLVMLDYNMPDLNGYETCKQIREIYPVEKLPVFLITADILNVRKLDLIAVGINEIIYKPVNEQKLLQSIIRYTLRDGRNSRDRPVVKNKVMDFLPKELVVKELKRLYNELKQAVEKDNIDENFDGNIDEIKKYAHQICGVAGPSTMYSEIEALARKIEVNLEKENYSKIKRLLTVLEAQMQKVQKNVKKGGDGYE